MRHQYPKLSAQAALIDSALPLIDDTLSKDFTITNVPELLPIGIDRIFFLGFVQLSVFYFIEPEESSMERLAIPLKDYDDQMTWPYQSLAQWVAIASVPRTEIYLFSMVDFKTRLINWKIKSDSAESVYIPWSELNLFKLKVYHWGIPESLIDRFGNLTWTPSSYQQSKQPVRPR